MSAGKNAAASIAFSGSQLLTALAITPLIQRGLGLEDFGLYVIFGQAANLLLVANPFPTNFVQWNVAREPDQLARTIGAAQAAYRRGAQIYAVVALVAISALAATRALTIERSVALALFTASFMTVRAGTTYDFAMTGLMSQAAFIRKRVGINLAAGLVQVLVAQCGLGLIAIAAVSFGASFLIYTLQRRFIYARCDRAPVADWAKFRERYGGESRQAYWGEVLYALNSWELVFLGFVASPAVTAAFSITGSLQRQGGGLVNAGIGGALPMVGRLRTSEGAAAAEQVVLRMNAAVAWLSVGAAALVVLVAEPIVTLLYGPRIFLGPGLAVPVTLLIVTAGLGTLNVQCWQYLGEVRLGNKLLVASLLAAVLGGVAGWWALGLPGFVWGTWLGRAIAPWSSGYLLAKRRTGAAIWLAAAPLFAAGAGVTLAWLASSQSPMKLRVLCGFVGLAVTVLLIRDLRWFRSGRGNRAVAPEIPAQPQQASR